jgi:flavin-dependent dehydrogenase
VARALAALPPGVEIPVERRLGRVESRFLDTGVAVTVERETTLVHMAMRAPLDLALAEAARAAGATLAAPRAVERIGLAADHVELDTTSGPLRARFLIGADGATGTVARAAGWTEPLASVPALEAEVEVPPRVLARFADRARFDLGVPVGGYGWIFPKADHLSIGVGVFTSGGARRRLRDELARYVHAAGLGDASTLRVRGAPIPVRPRIAARGPVLSNHLAEDHRELPLSLPDASPRRFAATTDSRHRFLNRLLTRWQPLRIRARRSRPQRD